MEIKIDPIKGKTADIVEQVMQSPDIPDNAELEFKIRLCVEEVVENIVSYAYENGQGYIIVNVSVEDGRLCLLFQDEGIPFNPLEKQDPDITLSIEDRPIGGLGIFLCKQMMDSMTYTYNNNQNNLKMEIRIQ